MKGNAYCILVALNLRSLPSFRNLPPLKIFTQLFFYKIALKQC